MSEVAGPPQLPSVIAVVGMHRSGTSCVVGTLEEAGVFLGNVFRANPYNAKGNHESARIMAFHDSLLAKNGGSWDEPPAHVHWDGEDRRERHEIIAAYEPAPRWGFKDPRVMLTIEGWLEALPQLRFAGVFRHPVAVARSLEARDGFALERGIALWTEYNRRLIRLHETRPFPLACFDLDADAFRTALAELLRQLDLEDAREPRFFEPELRHALADPREPLPADAAEVSEELRRRSL